MIRISPIASAVDDNKEEAVFLLRELMWASAHLISTNCHSVILRALPEESLHFKHYKNYIFCTIPVQRFFNAFSMTEL